MHFHFWTTPLLHEGGKEPFLGFIFIFSHFFSFSVNLCMDSIKLGLPLSII